jgi:hypothetical protein
MGKGVNILFNFITLIFVLLTIGTILVVAGVASDAMEPPILAAEEDVIPPTQYVPPTLPPIGFTPEATADLLATETPTP